MSPAPGTPPGTLIAGGAWPRCMRGGGCPPEGARAICAGGCLAVGDCEKAVCTENPRLISKGGSERDGDGATVGWRGVKLDDPEAEAEEWPPGGTNLMLPSGPMSKPAPPQPASAP
eukprot:3703166-Rhodomonas_salina.6